jgi:putative GTP pyrophosphokinase
VKEEFKIIEKERKGDDHTFREFGYESIHLLISLPENIIGEGEEFCCEVAELQVRTILQDAWAEVEHELIYKSEFTPYDNPLKRKLAAVSAFLFLADNIFQEVRSHQRELNGELRKRSNSFFRKVEESTDALLLNAGKPLSEDESLLEEGSKKSQPRYSNTSIDDLLLQALSAHNKNQFPQAIAVYSQILEMKTDDTIRSLIYKHRGMAFFACSNYEEAIADFSESLKLDPNSYKAAYYEGIVCSVVRRYPQAVDAFNRSLTINPYQQYCLFRRGQAYFHLEDYPKALGDCEAALSLEPFEAARKFKSLVLAQLKM